MTCGQPGNPPPVWRRSTPVRSRRTRGTRKDFGAASANCRHRRQGGDLAGITQPAQMLVADVGFAGVPAGKRILQDSLEVAASVRHGQAPNVVIDARGSGLDEKSAGLGLRRFLGSPWAMDRYASVLVLGDDYVIETASPRRRCDE